MFSRTTIAIKSKNMKNLKVVKEDFKIAGVGGK